MTPLGSRLAANPLVATANAALFAGLSRLRRKRIAHPHGVAFSASLHPTADAATAIALFGRAEPVAAIVRLSRSVGLPEALHDPCGLAIRVPDAHGPGLHQDLLLVTSGTAPVARHLLLPSGGFSARPYSSLVPYRLHGETVVVGAAPLDPPPGPSLVELAHREHAGLRLTLAVASPLGRWRRVGELRIEERLPEARGERLRLNPAHTGPALEPIGFLNSLRPAAYRGSQAGRARDRAR